MLLKKHLITYYIIFSFYFFICMLFFCEGLLVFFFVLFLGFVVYLVIYPHSNFLGTQIPWMPEPCPVNIPLAYSLVPLGRKVGASWWNCHQYMEHWPWCQNLDNLKLSMLIFYTFTMFVYFGPIQSLGSNCVPCQHLWQFWIPWNHSGTLFRAKL